MPRIVRPGKIGRGRRPWLRTQQGSLYQDSSQIRVPLVFNAPPKAQIGSVDFIPNLLMTTLAIVAVSLPPGKQLSGSAPQRKAQVQCEVYRTPLTLGINPNPAVRQQFDSAPPPKGAVYAEQQQNTLARGINPNPAIRQQFDSAPPPKAAVYAVQQHNILAQGINPNPAVRQLDGSAPQAKYRPQVDGTPNLLATTLAPASAAFPAGEQLSDSAPPLKSPVVALQQHNTLVLGINPNPAVRQTDGSAPSLKYLPQADTYPNLLVTTLAPVALPPGEQLYDSAPQARQNYSVDPQHRAPDVVDVVFPFDPATFSVVGQDIGFALTAGDQPSGGWILRAAERRRKLDKELQEEQEREELAERLESVLVQDGSLTQVEADLIRLRGMVAEYQNDLPNRTRRALAFAERAQSQQAVRLSLREMERLRQEEELAVLLVLSLD